MKAKLTRDKKRDTTRTEKIMAPGPDSDPATREMISLPAGGSADKVDTHAVDYLGDLLYCLPPETGVFLYSRFIARRTILCQSSEHRSPRAFICECLHAGTLSDRAYHPLPIVCPPL